jgi:hypothetical protein
MEGSRFDAWTRRRFGLAAGGVAGSLFGLLAREAAESKKKKEEALHQSRQGVQAGRKAQMLREAQVPSCGEQHRTCVPLLQEQRGQMR